MTTLNQFKQYLSYDPSSGKIEWIKSPTPKIPAASVAGSINLDGYRQIKFQNKIYQASHVAWFLTHGIWPAQTIDHINGIRDDDRIVNLRESSHQENCCSRVVRSDSTSKLKGVSKHNSQWRARIWDPVLKKNMNLGVFTSSEFAAKAYDKMAIKIHGKFAKTNKSMGLI